MKTGIYYSVMAKSESPFAVYWMALLSFTESSFFIIPPDLMLVPICIGRPNRAFTYALICTLSSVIGGMLGYYIGYAFFEILARPIIDFYSASSAFERFKINANNYGFWIISLKGLTPIPYKVIAIASGAIKYPFLSFVIASVIGRGIRFFTIAALCYRYGSEVSKIMEKNGSRIMYAVIAFIFLGFILIKLV